jgi:ABC-type antimicrobial peptide transport system permease subunit
LDFQPSGIRTATSRGHTVWDFSILALALAAVGLYSVVSYSVATRTNEFGIRMALGAKATDVFRMVLSSTAVNLGGGLAIGILLSIAFDKLAPKWVTESSRDPLILAGVTLLLIVAAALACFVPARRFRRSHGKLRSE